ncbi:peroxidase 65-like [Humulus lupulus]|uniref:peroxidase 65-like n=1 Tax=Humulus lupulus TaxID=3486 RepID=UPI002B40ABC2|nr:peroxidase 65-like [Humulus lupulus]
MVFPPLLLLVLLSFSPFVIVESKLSLDYYNKKCPDFGKIIRETVTAKQISNPTTAAGTLRLFFHDCMVEGCDASVLISSNHAKDTERDADLNFSLPGDAFDVVVRAKTALELSCPGIVSCSDILAQTTRDLIIMVGGPFYKVRLGRKDGMVSKASLVEGSIPRVNHTMDQMIKLFENKGFTVQEMVALTGAHTIGFSHCKEFADRLFHFNKPNTTDPEIHPLFAAALKITCANYTKDPGMSAFNDVMTPGKFDNMYYKNLKKGLGLLSSDNAMLKDPRTKPIIELYATDQQRFFDAFSHAMEKLSVYEVKTGRKGEVRRKCDAFN